MSEQCRRVDRYEEGDNSEYFYFKNEGIWYLNLPGCGLANLANHKIIEHEDATITASPSILMTGQDNGKYVQKHGYLEKGVWRAC